MSGAGKTQVMRTLEDLNYFCVDNLPPTLIPKFTELCGQTEGKVTKIAFVVDIRGGEFFKEMISVLDEMKLNGTKYELLFLDASNEVLIRRYKETRRRHPLAKEGSLTYGIAKEREKVGNVRARATHILDTTNTTPSELRSKIIEMYGSGGNLNKLAVIIQSFGFKHGIPLDCDMMLDVRFLPNPFYIRELKELTGNDQDVMNYIWNYQVTREFVKKLEDLLLFLLPEYEKEGKNQFIIAIGCTGGVHRSVYIANKLRDFLREHEFDAQTAHRDLNKK
ncbi:MAG TPA: RNase adapter RapZ [Candidatus Avacidaminococcus intestinavium]|uniref:RNase adapter RapZ n=1 Tax=Candidatus Avacidaminococcus intestinavium TaxID=2840684 RepID=A0A9D1MQB0_9FIRM|nr:RNase adapter RapZ [Candidatus Avacidaminococcus intestinavium]